MARYFREWDPFWFYFHGSVQSLGFALGVIGVITGLVLVDKLQVDVGIHKAIGIIILVLASLQVYYFFSILLLITCIFKGLCFHQGLTFMSEKLCLELPQMQVRSRVGFVAGLGMANDKRKAYVRSNIYIKLKFKIEFKHFNNLH